MMHKTPVWVLNSVCIAVSSVSLVFFVLVIEKIQKVDQQAVVYTQMIDELFTETTAEPNDTVSLPAQEHSSSTIVTEEDVVAQEPVSIPPQALLAVPFTSQAPEGNWEQPWQDACEEAAVLMMDAFYKGYNLSPLFAKDELQKMVNWEGTKGWGGSIEMDKIKILLDDFVWKKSEIINQKSKIIENPTIDDMKRFIANNTPVLVVADGKKLPNPNFTNGGPVYHALVIIGYTETVFITNDPGTRNGEKFEYLYADLMNAIGDWNNGTPSEGRKVVLVLEE